MIHIPVLTKEVIRYLDPKTNENFIDCTVGEAGHAMAILGKNGPGGKVLGIDWDLQQIKNSELLMAGSRGRLILINDSYANLQEIVEKINFKPVNGILLDLGMSSEQLEGPASGYPGRGFTFLKDEPLDMRYAHEIRNSNIEIRNLTAEEIVNKWPEKEIEKILREYGEEKFARKIAKEIVKKRKAEKIKSTFQLVQVIKEAMSAKFQSRWQSHRGSSTKSGHGKIHCATKTFQALRIAVNSELENLKKVLPQAVSILSSEGRLVIISFHSLEDRIVKNFFREKSKEGAVKLLFKKPVTAEADELNKNPRSRSAKLRAVTKIL